MARDTILIRKLLVHAGEPSGADGLVPAIEGYSHETIYQHIRLCEDAGYLTDSRIVHLSGGGYGYKTIGRTTMSGHDFLEQTNGNSTAPPNPFINRRISS